MELSRAKILKIALLVLVALAICPFYLLWSFYGFGPLRSETYVLVTKGMTVNQAVEALSSNGVIRNKWLFKAWARFAKPVLIRGEYLFSPRTSMSDVADKLVKGKTHIIKLLISPSLHRWSLQKRLEPYIPAETFWELWENPKLATLAGFPEAPSLEGLIAPATYNINRAMEPEEIMTQMVETFNKQVLPTLDGGVLPPYETLILASLAEKETNIPEELPRITGVFYNRLNAPMLLQCDPTSLYARWMSGDLRFTAPTRVDTNRKHPYNTYTDMGLPPTPIAIPSRAAIEAAKTPMDTEDFYFVATGKGGHNFSQTLSEHNNYVNIFRAEVSKQKKASGASPAAKNKTSAAPAAKGVKDKSKTQKKTGEK
jgi:UPF0755 protein